MTKDEALKLALEALEMFCEHGAILRPIETRNAIREALAQPEQEHVACPFPCGWKTMFAIVVKDGAFLAQGLIEGEPVKGIQRETVMRLIDYAKTMALHGMKSTPPHRKPLSDEEIAEIWGKKPRWHSPPIGLTDIAFARDIEQAHGIKEKT